MPGGYPSSWEICNGTDAGTNTSTSLGTAVTNSGTAGTYGSYTQLVASSASDTCFISVNMVQNVAGFPTSNDVSIKIAVGAGGSEVDIIKNLVCWNGASQKLIWNYVFPVAIPAGTRISAAAVGSQSGTADVILVTVTLFDGAFAQIEGCAGVDSIGFSSGHGTSVSSGAANTKGSYVQLSASTPRDYLGFSIGYDAAGSATSAVTAGLLDIAIGGAGSEVIIIPNLPFINTGGYMTDVPGIFAIPIPAGTRVAARMQNSGGTGAIGITLYGIYQ